MRRLVNTFAVPLALTALTALAITAGAGCVIVDETQEEDWEEASAWCDEDGCWYCDAWGCYAYGCDVDSDCPESCSCSDGQCFGDEFGGGHGGSVDDRGDRGGRGGPGGGHDGRGGHDGGGATTQPQPDPQPNPQPDPATGDGDGGGAGADPAPEPSEIPCRASCECPEGNICERNVCVAPAPEPVDAPAPLTACVVDCDCPAGDRCEEAFCRASCEIATDCGAGLACVDGACMAAADVKPPEPAVEDRCQFDHQCAGGACLNGACHARCDDGQACPAGEACLLGLVCDVAADRTPECVYSADCDSEAALCIDGACEITCSADDGDAACADGQLCERGLCQADRLPSPQCLRSDECVGGLTCVDAVCRSACGSDSDCSAGGACDRGFCISAAELSPECATREECAGGASCLNAACLEL